MSKNLSAPFPSSLSHYLPSSQNARQDEREPAVDAALEMLDEFTSREEGPSRLQITDSKIVILGSSLLPERMR